MVDFLKHDNQLIMRYTPSRGEDDWLVKPLESEEEIPLSGNAFNVRQEIYRPETGEDGFLTAWLRLRVRNFRSRRAEVRNGTLFVKRPPTLWDGAGP